MKEFPLEHLVQSHRSALLEDSPTAYCRRHFIILISLVHYAFTALRAGRWVKSSTAAPELRRWGVSCALWRRQPCASRSPSAARCMLYLRLEAAPPTSSRARSLPRHLALLPYCVVLALTVGLRPLQADSRGPCWAPYGPRKHPPADLRLLVGPS